jgi:CheY-like chemotaxis protein
MLRKVPRRILAIEYETLVLMLIEDTLSAAGFEVETAATGTDALKAACQNPPDLVVMDFELNEPPNGAELLQRLRSAVLHPLPALVFSVHSLTPEERHALDQAGGGPPVRLITKPFEADDLVAITEVMLNQR